MAYLFHEVVFSARFIQGYRFLDRCGEALVRLEEVLDSGWIPTETAPKGGSIKNDVAGMMASFNSETLLIQQSEYFDLGLFRDQASKIFSVLRDVFKIDRINVPVLRVVLQRGFHDLDVEQANRHLLSLKLCSVAESVHAMLGGVEQALDFVLITNSDIQWEGEPVSQRRRFAASVVRQERRPNIDERLMRRVRLLPTRQRDALAALGTLRSRHPEIAPVAIQFDIEHTFEKEFFARSFDMPSFIDQNWQWAIDVQRSLDKLKAGVNS